MPIENARRLRRDATDSERKLWTTLRDRRLAGYRFRRQHPIANYIVDFAWTKQPLIIEADGGQHADSDYDAQRAAFLQSNGWRVVCVWNNYILFNPEGVIQTILQALRVG